MTVADPPPNNGDAHRAPLHSREGELDFFLARVHLKQDGRLEELLLRHALGESVARWRRESGASGVMMIPIPTEGVYRGVTGVEEALAVPHVSDVRITAKSDQHLLPLPEGASYLGFIFAKAERPDEVEHALREAHGKLSFLIDRAIPTMS